MITYPDSPAGKLQQVFDSSKFARAAKKAGFKFGSISFKTDVAHLQFTCVCGKVEDLHINLCGLWQLPDFRFDMAEELHNEGSFTKAHLLGEGYSEEDAEKISSTYDRELARV